MVCDGSGHIADRQAADLAGGRSVAFEQRGRERQRARDVVEAARGIVGRQELAGIDFDVQQIANGVRVFGAVQAVQAGGGQICRGVLDPVRFRAKRSAIRTRRLRPRHAGGGHHAGANFVHNSFPVLRVLFNVRHIEIVEGYRQARRLTGFLHLLVVADDTVLIEKGAFGYRSHGGGRRR